MTRPITHPNARSARFTRQSCIILCCLGMVPTAMADTLLGLYAKADYWSATLDGEFGNGNSNGFLKSLNGDPAKDQHIILSAHFEHGLPLIPNVWVRHNSIEYQETQSLQSNVAIGPATLTAGSPVEYNFNMSHTDAALYYELLDNWVSIDLGLGLKKMAFDYSIRQGALSFVHEKSSTIPMLYAKAAFELPFTGWQATAQAMALSFKDDRIEDVTLELGYNLNDVLQVSLGYRQMVIDVETQAIPASEMTLNGSYLSVTAHL